MQREIVRRFGAISPTVTILDVGCGTGLLLTIPLAQAGFRVHGIDLDASSVAFARATAERQGLTNATFSCCDVSSIDACSFDIVLCSEVLEHVPDYSRFFGVVLEKMKRCGLVILTVPNGRGPFELQSALWRRWISEDRVWTRSRALYHRLTGHGTAAASLSKDGHVNFFTVGHLEQLFDEHKLQIIQYEGRTLLAGTLFWWAGLPLARELNSWLGSVVPARFVSDWMFSLERDSTAVSPVRDGGEPLGDSAGT